MLLRDVEVALNKASEFFASFNNMLSDPSAVDPAEFDWTSKELRKLVASITEDLEELGETVDAVKMDPKRFKACFVSCPRALPTVPSRSLCKRYPIESSLSKRRGQRCRFDVLPRLCPC
jgi:hypothetical protein